MIRRTSFFLVAFFSGIPLFAQQITIAFKPVYGSYKMDDMHALQDEQYSNIFDSLKTKPKEIYEFPSYWGAEVRAGFSLKRHNFSFTVANATTGGRLHYEDYSGVIKADKIVNNTSLGIGYGYLVMDKKRLKVTSALTIGRASSTLKTDDHVEIYLSDEETASTGNYTSHQLFITPEARIQYFPVKFLFIEASAGYVMQLKSTPQKDKNGMTLVGKKKNEVDLDWSGARLGVGIGFLFNVKK